MYIIITDTTNVQVFSLRSLSSPELLKLIILALYRPPVGSDLCVPN